MGPKIVFIGAGRISHFHYSALIKAGAQVVGVCTRGNSGLEFAEKFKVPYFSSVAEMCNVQKPDGAYLLTQPSSYLECFQALKPFNLPVLLEKPVSYTSDEAELLRSFLPDKVMVGQNRRFYGNIQPLRALAEGPEKLTIHAHCCERSKDIATRSQKDRDNWHTMNAVHLVDLLKYVFGKPESFFLRRGWGQLDFPSRLTTYTNAGYTSSKGHDVYFNSNFDSPGGWRIMVFSKAQEYLVQPIETTTLKVIGSTSEYPTCTDDREFKPGFVAQAKCFIEGIRASSKLPQDWVSFDDGLESVYLAETIYLGSPIQ